MKHRRCDWCGREGDYSTKPRVSITLCEKLTLCTKCEAKHYPRCVECQSEEYDAMVDDYFDDIYEEYYND